MTLPAKRRHRYQDDLKRQILNILNKQGAKSITSLQDMLAMNHYQVYQFIGDLVKAKLVDSEQKKSARLTKAQRARLDVHVRMVYYITEKGRKCLELMNQVAVMITAATK